MDSTCLTLLTAEGKLVISFRPQLDAEQYALLCRLIGSAALNSRRDFCELLAQAAAEWGVAFEAEEWQLH